MPPRLHLCPECDTLSIATAEQKGSIHLDCPVCLYGRVFRDGRGGYECSECDQRFLIHEPHRNDHYGGPEHVGGPLRWWERPATDWGLLGLCAGWAVVLWLVPVPYWSLFFLLCLAWEQWVKKR